MKQYNILDYGAIADGVTNNAAAIQQAIDEASAEGGCVVIPQGKYLSGTLVLKEQHRLPSGEGGSLDQQSEPGGYYGFCQAL